MFNFVRAGRPQCACLYVCSECAWDAFQDALTSLTTLLKKPKLKTQEVSIASFEEARLGTAIDCRFAGDEKDAALPSSGKVQCAFVFWAGQPQCALVFGAGQPLPSVNV